MTPDIDFQISSGFYVYLAVLLLLLPFPWLAALLFSGSVHEIGHLIVLKIMKIPVRSISLYPAGARILTAPMTNKQEFLASAAGPALESVLVFFLPLFPRLACCALVQTIFNLLPVVPFDGGRLLRCAAIAVVGKHKAEKACRTASFFAAGILIILSVILFKFSVIAAVVLLLLGFRCIKNRRIPA